CCCACAPPSRAAASLNPWNRRCNTSMASSTRGEDACGLACAVPPSAKPPGAMGGRMSYPRVLLKPRRARPFFGLHPWVYAGAIESVDGSPADGDVVDLVSSAGNFVARGLYNSKSKIRVRLYSWSDQAPLDDAFFRARLEEALHLRRDILGLVGPAKACRLVFSESDGLSGCAVDSFDRWLVVQFTGLGLAQRREQLADILVDLLKPEGIYLRTERGIGQLEGLELHDGPLRGAAPAEPI